jgi:hypothetical protein
LHGHCDAASSRPLEIQVGLAKELSRHNVHGGPR